MSRLIVVTGGRKFAAADVVDTILDTLHAAHKLLVLAHGGAVGADTLADEWGLRQPGLMRPVCYAVDEKFDGPWPRAGFRRNGRMLRGEMVRAEQLFEPAPLVVAFDGGRGTKDCMKQALELGLNVWKVTGDGPWHTQLLTPAWWATAKASPAL